MGRLDEGNRGNNMGENMSGLRAADLIGRCIKQIWMHRGFYRGILIFIVLPGVAVHQVTVLFSGSLQDILHTILIGDVIHVKVKRSTIIQTIALGLASDLLQAVLVAIQYIFIVYTVASFLTNRTDILADATGAVGRLWKPAVLTSLCLLAAIDGSMAIAAAIMYALYLLARVALPFAILGGLFQGLFISALPACFGLAFPLGLVVPVLEEGVYGWEALGKSWKLLEGKRWTGVEVTFFLFMVAKGFTALFQLILRLVLELFGISTNTTSSVVNFLPFLVISSLSILLGIGVQTLLYFSSKALHQESITDSIFFQGQVKNGGYEEITQHSESYDIESKNTPGS